MGNLSTSFKGLSDLPYITEQLRVTKHTVTARVNVLSGKEGDVWVFYSASLNTSGYGDTKKEAQDSFIHNVELFCKHLLKQKQAKQHQILREYGWERKRYASKQFSKAYVDENGDLQNLTNAKVQALETVAA